MTNLIPASYLAAGKLTFESDAGLVYWSLAWGGASYSGTNTGQTDNDADGNFSPPFAGPLPSPAPGPCDSPARPADPSTNNAADYALTAGSAVFTNNAGTSGTRRCPLPLRRRHRHSHQPSTPTRTITPTSTQTPTPSTDPDTIADVDPKSSTPTVTPSLTPGGVDPRHRRRRQHRAADRRALDPALPVRLPRRDLDRGSGGLTAPPRDTAPEIEAIIVTSSAHSTSTATAASSRSPTGS